MLPTLMKFDNLRDAALMLTFVLFDVDKVCTVEPGDKR